MIERPAGGKIESLNRGVEMNWELAELNIARMMYEPDGPEMTDFNAALDAVFSDLEQAQTATAAAEPASAGVGCSVCSTAT